MERVNILLKILIYLDHGVYEYELNSNVYLYIICCTLKFFLKELLLDDNLKVHLNIQLKNKRNSNRHYNFFIYNILFFFY